MLSVIALFVALGIDLPDLNETGLIGRTYDQAEARPRVGFFVETLGARSALLGPIGACCSEGDAEHELPAHVAALEALVRLGGALEREDLLDCGL